MSSAPYLVETTIFLLVAFALGGALGFWARRRFALQTAPVEPASPPPATKAKPEPVAVAAQPEARTAEPATAAKPAPIAKPKPTAKSRPAAKSAPAAKPVPAAKSAPVAKPKPAAKAKAKPAAASAPVVSAADAGKPVLIAAPRGGVADDLKKIGGIGPKIEKTLNELGVYHFDQVAAWDEVAIEWVDSRLSFHGRVTRENWVEQAKALAKGK